MNASVNAAPARGREWLLDAAAFVWAAVFFYFSLGAGQFALGAWLAPIPLLMRALQARTRGARVRVAIAAGLAYFLGIANLLVVYWGLLPFGVLVASLLPAGLGYGVTVLVFASLARRLPTWIAVLGFASAWTAAEYLVSITSPDGTAGSIAYSQAMWPAMIQGAAWFGQFVITFLLCFVPASIAAALVARRVAVALPAVVLLVLNVGLGYASLNTTPTATLRIGLLSSDAFPEAHGAKTREQALAPLPAYAAAIERLARGGARVVLLPERVTALRPEWQGEVETELSRLATQHGVRLIVGLGDFTREPASNIAMLFEPSGAAPITYVKHRLIPGFESVFAPGTERLRFDESLAIAICKDMDFQDVARDYGRAGVGLLFAPAWDFGADAELHQRMSVLRAVEGGFALARSAREGRLTVHTARGEPLALAHSGDTMGELLLDVPTDRRDTLYPRIGDVFPRAVALLFVLIVSGALWRRPRAT